MTTWLENAIDILEKADAEIPDDVPVDERRKLLSKHRPASYSDTSWGKKVWPKAMKKVLGRHIKADSAVPGKYLSPLERMMRRAGH